MHSSGLRGMYHYEGSLTTPGCQEIVQWIVMDRPLYVRRWGLVRTYTTDDKRLIIKILFLKNNLCSWKCSGETLTTTGIDWETTSGPHRTWTRGSSTITESELPSHELLFGKSNELIVFSSIKLKAPPVSFWINKQCPYARYAAQTQNCLAFKAWTWSHPSHIFWIKSNLASVDSCIWLML